MGVNLKTVADDTENMRNKEVFFYNLLFRYHYLSVKD